jgi:hypothetical protein
MGIAINIAMLLGPLLLWIGIDRWLESRDRRLPRWSYLFPAAWVLIAGWLVYSCTLIDSCS